MRAVAYGIASFFGLHRALQFRLARLASLFVRGFLGSRGLFRFLLFLGLFVGRGLVRCGLLCSRFRRGLFLGLEPFRFLLLGIEPLFFLRLLLLLELFLGQALFFALALDLGGIRLGRPLLLDGARVPARGSGAGGSGSDFGGGAIPLSARSSTTVASMAMVVTGGGWCFQVNQP